MHHIIIDMWSLGLVMFEVPRLHAQIAASGRPDATPPRTTYADHVAWEAEMLSGPEGERLQMKRDLICPPLFQVMFAWQKVSSQPR